MISLYVNDFSAILKTEKAEMGTFEVSFRSVEEVPSKGWVGSG